MVHTLTNGKKITIPDTELQKLMSNLQISQADAIDLWLDDNGIKLNEDAEELNEKAKKVKINHESTSKTRKKSDKPREKKVSDEKKELFSEILSDLEDVYKENVAILNENKLISVKIGDKTFKIDVIECRPPKN